MANIEELYKIINSPGSSEEARKDIDSALGALATSASKVDILNRNKEAKAQLLNQKITGLYDADSPVYDGKTTRITESNYYAQAPELKDATGQLTREGINARIMADNYAMGMKNVPKYDLNSETIDPRYYKQYSDAMDSFIKERATKGQYNVYDTGATDKYGRQLVKAQSSDMPMSQTDFLIQQGAAKKVIIPQQYAVQNVPNADGSVDIGIDKGADKAFVRTAPSSIKNGLKGFAYILADSLANTADLIAEGVEYAATDKKWSDVQGLYTKERAEAFKKWTGHNDEVMNKLGAEGEEAIKQAREKGDYWGLLKTLGKAVTTPELVLSSLGYVAGLVLPGTAGVKAVQLASGVAKTAKAAMAADKTGKLTEAAALANAEKAAGPGYKLAKVMSGQVGYASGAEQFGRDAEELYKKTYNEEMPTEQKLAARGLGLAYVYMDALTAKAILLGKDPITKAIPDMLKKLPSEATNTFVKKVATTAGVTATKAAGMMGLEGVTEATQTGLEKIAGQVRLDKEDIIGQTGDVLAKNIDEIGAAGLLGGAGGIQMGGPALAVGAGKDIRSVLSENLAEPRQAGAEAVEAVTTPKPVETPMTFADIMKSLKTDLNTIDVFDQKQSALAISKLNSLKALATEEDTEELDQLKLNFTSKINEKLAKVKTADGKIDTNVFGSDPATFLEEFAYADEDKKAELISALSSDDKYASLGQALSELGATGDNRAKDILDGIAIVQNQIAKGEFATSKNVHRSMVDNYKLASSTNEDEARIGIDKMQEFSLSQQEKKAKLEAGLNESLNRMNNTVNRLAAARSLPIDTVIKALVDLEQLTIADKDGEIRRKGYMNDVLALTNADNIDAAKKVYKEAIKPILHGQVPTQGVQYSVGILSQTAKNGVFEIDFKNTLAAYAENNNIEVQKKSAAKRLINSIDTEIQALDTLVAMAGKNREAKSQAIAALTETMDKVGIDTAELGQQEVVKEPVKEEKATTTEPVKPVEAKKDVNNKDLKKAKQIVNSKLAGNSSYAEIKKAIDELTLEDTVKSNLLKYTQDKIGKRRIISDKKLEAVKAKAELDKVRTLVDRKITLFKELVKEGKELYTTNRSKLGRLYGEIRGYKDMVAEYTQQIKELSIDNIKAGKALDSLDKQRDTVIAKIKQLKREDKTSGDYESKLTALRDELKAIDEKISELQKDISRRRSLVTEALDERAKTEEKAKLVETAVKEAEQETITKLSDKSKAIRARSNAEVAKIIGETKVKIKGKDEQLPLGEHKDGKYPFNIQLNKLYKAEYGSKLSDTAASDIKGVRTLATRAVELLSNEAVSKGKSKDNTFSESIMSLVDMARPLIYDGSGDNIKINENVATALAIATINVVDETIVRMAEFDEELIEKYYGIAPDGLSAASKAQLEELGIPVKYLVEDIGRRTKEYLGIKLVKDTADAKELDARIERSLGMHGLLMYSGDSKALITAKQTSSKDIAKLLNTVESTVNVDTVKNTTPLVTTVSINKKVVAKAKSYIDPIVNKLEVAEIDGAHKWEPIENINRKATIVRRNPFSKVPKAISDKVKEFMGYEWKVKQGTAFDKLKELGKDRILELEGYKTDEELASMIYDNRASAESKNMALAREVEYLLDVYNKITSGEKNNTLYFDWFVAKSFRMMIDSNEFNPQSKKLHRSMVYVDKMKSNIDVNDEKQMKAFLLGIAQAFGYDIDKGNNKAIEAAKKLLEVDTEELLNSIPTKGKEYEVPGTELKIERPVLTHYLDGIQAIVDYQTREGDTFDTMLTVETDAVTNGAILKMMQYLQGPLNNTVGIGKNAITNKELIKKGGILTEEYAQLDMTALRGSGTLEDSYQTQAKDVTEAKIMAAFHDGVNRKKNPVVLPKGVESEEAITPLVNILGAGVKIEVIDGTEEQIAVVTKKGRELAKYPYMTFWYGAGKKKITGELADNLVEDLVQKLYDNELIETKDKDVEALKKALKLTTADVKELKNKSVYYIPLDDTTVGATLKSWLAESYGAAMWGVLEDRFADIIEINDAINTSVIAMFEVWEQEYKKVIEERNAATIDEQNAIALELLELFPMLKVATSGGLSDSMALFSTKVVDRKLDSKYGRTGVYTKKAVGEKSDNRSMYIVDLVKEYAAPKAAGAVLPIHALDSSNVATSAKDILQIWDAYMSGVGQTEDMVKAFNKATYENSMKWNYIEEVRNAITRVLDTEAGKNYLNKLNQEGSKSAITKLEKLQKVLELLKGRAAGNAEFKKALQEVPVSIQHMPYTKDSGYSVASNNEKQAIIKPKDDVVKTMKANDIMAEVNKCKE